MPNQPPARNAAQIAPNAPKRSTGAGGPNTKPKNAGPSTHDSTTKPSDPQRVGTQKGVMERANGAPPQPKQGKPATRSQSKRTTTAPALHATPPDDTDDFDLRPQTQKKKSPAVDVIAESLFSGGHLDTILHDPQLFVGFNAFLNRYRPPVAPILSRYLETQKAIKAVEYANAVAASVAPLPSDGSLKTDVTAAHIDSSFREIQRNAFEQLITEALPAYVTYSLIKVTTEIMVNEITGRSTPIMKGLISGLSEVFCLTDPNQEDNPIIYASDEFYHMTGYARDFVIGTNCRFLQGPKTKRHSVQRLRQAIDSGQELSEALLNYRRDGRPFLNILMIAPLHDNKGNVKYHIGAQVDASGLIEGGKGLESFQQYLSSEAGKRDSRGRPSGKGPMPPKESVSSKEAKKKALEKLGELSAMFDLEESAIVAQRSRSNSRDRRSLDEESIGSGRSRRVFSEPSGSESDEEGLSEKEKAAWTLSQRGSSGRLPGVYESYLLMRPSPSLKIIFTSPTLRKMGNIVQSTFLSHITAPPATLKGLKESFKAGNPVTAKVLFSAQASDSKSGRELDRGQSKKDVDEASSSKLGRTCWVSATPLLGGDDEIGVWMVVLVDQRSLGSGTSHLHSDSKSQRTPLDKSGAEKQSDSSPKQVLSNSTSIPSKTTRPNHIAMPDRLGTQQKAHTQPTNSVQRSSVENGSPQPRNSSIMPLRKTSGVNIMPRRDEQLHRVQHTWSSPPSTPQQKKDPVEEDDEFVRKHELRDLSNRSNWAYIQPDIEDEDEDFQLATETGVEKFFDVDMAPNGQGNVPVGNGSVLGTETNAAAEKDSNAFGGTGPEKTADRGAEDLLSPLVTQDLPPEQDPELVPAAVPAPTRQPLSKQALESHNAELATQEGAMLSGEAHHAIASEDHHMSPFNQISRDPKSDADPPIPAEAEVEDGEFEPTNIKDGLEPEHDGDAEEIITATNLHDCFHEVDESWHPKSVPADTKTAGGYMDYLRHPGSRPGSGGGRTITATNLASQGYTVAELKENWDRHEDPHCDTRTPFSVD